MPDLKALLVQKLDPLREVIATDPRVLFIQLVILLTLGATLIVTSTFTRRPEAVETTKKDAA